MKKILVLGVGSTFGADNIGEIVIKKLKKRVFCQGVAFDYLDRPGFHLIERMKAYEIVHLIDAMQSDKPFGYVHRIENLNVLERSQQTLSSHGYGIAQVLALADVMDLLPKKLVIHGIEINMTDRCVSPKIISSCERLVENIRQELDETL